MVTLVVLVTLGGLGAPLGRARGGLVVRRLKSDIFDGPDGVEETALVDFLDQRAVKHLAPNVDQRLVPHQPLHAVHHYPLVLRTA